MEYALINQRKYETYHENALRIIREVKKHTSLEEKDITYKEVIQFFEHKFNIKFVYLSENFYQEFTDVIIEDGLAKRLFTRHSGILSNYSVAFTDDILLETCSGMTIPFESDRYVVYINQDVTAKGRVIFTILHELSHIYCHLENHSVKRTYVLLSNNTDTTDNYPEEIAPFEDEANTVASILFLNDERLKSSLEMQMTFRNLAKDNSMSDAALHNRLMNYLIFNEGYDSNKALSYVCRYRYDNIPLTQNVE